MPQLTHIQQYPYQHSQLVIVITKCANTRVLAAVKNSAVNAVFPKLANGGTSQFRFLKYLIEYQNVKIVKSTFKNVKSQKNKHKSNVVIIVYKKKNIKIEEMCVT